MNGTQFHTHYATIMINLRNERLQAHSEAKGFGEKFGVLPTRDDDSLAVMVWNFEDGMEGDVNQRQVEATIDHISFSGSYALVHYRIDGEHSSAYAAWKMVGKPVQPTVEQIKTLRTHEELALVESVKQVVLNGTFSITLDLPMHAVSLLLVPHSAELPATPQWIKAVVEQGYNGNQQVFLKWLPNTEKDFLHYRLLRQQNGGEFVAISDHAGLHTAVYTDMDVSAGEAYTYKVQAVRASGQASDLSGAITVKS